MPQKGYRKNNKDAVCMIFSVCFTKIQSKLFYKSGEVGWENKCALRIKYRHKKSRILYPAYVYSVISKM
jgi:hypothetical protein